MTMGRKRINSYEMRSDEHEHEIEDKRRDGRSRASVDDRIPV